MVDITPQIERSQTEPILWAPPKLAAPVGTDPPGWSIADVPAQRP